MIVHLLKTALRNIRRHKLFSFINIFGLALSLSFCLLVIMIVSDQTSFDKFHPRSEDTYRVITNAQRKNGNVESYASSPYPLGEVLASESPAVERVVHFVRGLSADVERGDARIGVTGFFTDEAFFEVFGFRLDQGKPADVLDRPNSVVLSAETSRKFFGKKDAMGETIRIRGVGDFVVTGVLAPNPGKTHMEFDILASLASMPVLERGGDISAISSEWKNYYSNYTYVRLRAGHSAEELEPLLASVQSRFYGNLELESRDKGYGFELQKLSEISPGRLLSQSLGRAVPEIVLYFLSALGLIGMLAALFNYTNLTLARSLARAREIGLRKVVGASRRDLFVQIIGESVLTSALALILAFVILQSVLVPGFQSLQLAEGSDITLEFAPMLILPFGVFTLLIGLAAGLVPATVMSGFRPVAVLKDISKVRLFSGLTLRKSLLVLQFGISMLLLIVLTIMVHQIRHAISMDYGMNWRNTMAIRLQGQDALRVAQQFGQHPNVASMTAISHHPLTWEDGSSDVRINRSDEAIGVREYGVDANFIDVFGLTLVAGSNFFKDLPLSNERLVIVNERFVEKFRLGTSQEAVGRPVLIGDSTDVRIAGVVKDFLFKPATYELEPLMLRFTPNNWNVLAVRLKGGDAAETSRYFEDLWKKIDPYHPYAARMYDDIMVEVYDVYDEMITLIGFLAGLAFVISLLGLLGIVTFQVESRIKEIGIRKVLGAHVGNLILLLARKELTLLLISTILTVPLAIFVASLFLESFAHRVQIGLGNVMPGILVVYLFALATIGVQALRASLANPVEALRYE